MKNLNSLLLLMTLVCFNLNFAQSQNVIGSGSIVSEMIKMDNISKVSLGISANVYLTQGNKQSIEIKGQQNIIDLISKEAKGNTWEIKFPRNSKVKTNEKLEIHITMKDLKGLNIGGSGSIFGQNEFKNIDDVSLNVGGSGSLELALQAEEINANIGGSGGIKLEGSAEEINANIGGSGSIKAINLKVKDANVNAAGSGSIQIDVSDELSATIAGSGSVKYKGDPKIDKRIVGSGKVRSY